MKQMIPVKTQPKFKCDFCKRRSVKHVIAKHEPSCYKNPQRVCFKCQNDGFYLEEQDDFYGGTDMVQVGCSYCETHKAIKEWLMSPLTEEENTEEVPF